MSPQALSDAQVLAAVLRRDEAAWRELLRRHSGTMFRCITKVVGRRRAVESDVVGEIFAELCCNLLRDDLRRLRAYDPARGAQLSSWLGLLAIHTAYDYLRQVARRPSLDAAGRLEQRIGATIADEPSALDALIEKERWRELSGMMGALSARDQRFVELYYGARLAPEQVAHAMTISIKTVYSKKNKLKRKLLALSRRAA